MLKNYIYQNYTYIIVVSLYSFFINYYFANFGALPIDTFAFFDTGYNILEGRHPFKDYWVTTGPFVDYFQSLFFLIFGKSWSSYVIHGSFLNFFISISFYITLTKLSLNKNYSLIYSIVFATLAYTISGTPFAYIHSYIFSLFAILLFAICVNTNSKKGFLILPIILILSFLSMQNPSTFIIFLTVIGSFIFFYKFNQLGLFLYFALGSIIGIVLFFLFFLITGINISDFIQQYILFPLSIGTNRVTDSNLAHFGISDRLTIRGTIGHFKFIHLYLLSIFFITIYFFKKKLISNEFLFINIIIILSGICFIFNQLITSNQTYIFSFIPFAAAFLHISLMKKFKNNLILNYFLLFIVIMISLKYHFVYNTERKFHDLQNVNINNALPANLIDKKLDGLKWITQAYSDNPKKEINLLKEAIQAIRNDKKNKMVLTHYQFFTLILNENLNILNRWYTNDGNSYPLKNSKYSNFFEKHLNDHLQENNIQNIYLVGDKNFDEFFKMFFNSSCYEKKIINEISKVYYPKKC